jgi:hypothetical protein
MRTKFRHSKDTVFILSYRLEIYAVRADYRVVVAKVKQDWYFDVFDNVAGTYLLAIFRSTLNAIKLTYNLLFKLCWRQLWREILQELIDVTIVVL